MQTYTSSVLNQPHDPPTPYNISSLGPAGGRLAPTLPALVPGSVVVGRPDFLPLNLIAHILTYFEDDPATLAALCRTQRLLYYMALPLLWKNVTLSSSSDVRRKKRTCDGEMKEVTEGMGNASPFAMGLNALVTHPNVGRLVKRLRLEGEYGEGDPEVQRHSRAGRVSESAMMLNICVRAALERCTELEEFAWDIEARLMPTVQRGLADLKTLRSLHIRMPASRAAQPTGEIPAMRCLQRLVVTNLDPLCYPDDISTLIYEATELRDLQVHFCPRMREAGEPSVQLSHILRKNIMNERKLTLRRLGVYNFFGKPEAELTTKAANIATVEEFTSINSFGKDEDDASDLGATFMDQAWLEGENVHMPNLKVWRVDQLHRSHLRSFKVRQGMQKIYLINARHGQPNLGTQPDGTPSESDTTPNSATSSTTTNSGHSKHKFQPKSPSTPTPPPTLKELYLDTICKASGVSLQHLIFPHKWTMTTSMVAKLIRACPNLTQLSACIDCSDMEFAQMLLPFLRGLEAMRVTVMPSQDCDMTREEREQAQDTPEFTETLRELLSGDGYDRLRYIGMGNRVWEAGGWEEVVRDVVGEEGTLSDGMIRQETVRRRRLQRVSLDAVKDVAIWKVDSLDVI